MEDRPSIGRGHGSVHVCRRRAREQRAHGRHVAREHGACKEEGVTVSERSIISALYGQGGFL